MRTRRQFDISDPCRCRPCHRIGAGDLVLVTDECGAFHAESVQSQRLQRDEDAADVCVGVAPADRPDTDAMFGFEVNAGHFVGVAVPAVVVGRPALENRNDDSAEGLSEFQKVCRRPQLMFDDAQPCCLQG